MEHCGLIYMKDAEGKAHSGFPEKAYQKFADVLVGLGFKVARIGKLLKICTKNQGNQNGFLYIYIYIS